MPRAIPVVLRQEIVQRHQQGESLPAIAVALNLKLRTTRAIWQRFIQQGEASLALGYLRCGHPGPRYPAVVVAAAVTLKREHPTWGAGLARLELPARGSEQPVPSARTLQRWWRAAGLQPARSRQPPVYHGRAQAAHEVWEVDAKERIRLADGSAQSVLTVVDEGGKAALAAAAFPPRRLGERTAIGGASPLSHDFPAVGAAAADPGRSRPSLGVVE